MGLPSIYPTGVTIYKAEKCWNGYNLVPTIDSGALLFDMNGNEVRRWEQFHGFPNKLLPNGNLIGYSGDRNPKYGMQDGLDLVQVDYDGNIVWKFEKFEFIEDEGEEPRWMARTHHDYQREGNPVGYYVPGQIPEVNKGNTLILAHKTLYNEKISDKKLLDDVFYEVDWEGNILWQWNANEHFDEIGFSEDAKKTIYANPNMRNADGGVGDWLHINCMSYLGPNKHYDNGDERFNPENIIFDSREANFIAIISKKTGKIVWKIGPNWNDEDIKHIDFIIGPHHAHLIPQGLPGAGNILVFDNGGWGGYGLPNPSSKDGLKNALRDYSRVLEINPITLEIVWEFTPESIKAAIPTDAAKFYSPYVSSAQRLPNGNTLIDEGSDGRVFEVTAEKKIVWEWISPYFTDDSENSKTTNNMIYRAYRYPYDWVPQEEKPIEIEIKPIDIKTYRLENSGKFGAKSVVKVEGTIPYSVSAALCVAKIDESKKVNKEKLFTVNRNLFEEVIEEKKNIEKLELILFGAERCKHCKALHPIIEKVLERKFGLILVSGPTGSGKSTTLLSIIDILNDGKRKIITVEDPVETKVKGLVQIQVNEEIGVTFSEVLKSTLRNDPDIIVISEIRDEITAEIAVRAALTGHLVISTIHTNDAVSTIIRLTDMGIPKYLILDSLIGVIAQRLVGKKCDYCSGEGCEECSGGYRGRTSINEVLIVGDEVKNILKSENLGRKSKEELKRNAEKYFVDFDGDIKDKLSKNMIFEKDVYEFID